MILNQQRERERDSPEILHVIIQYIIFLPPACSAAPSDMTEVTDCIYSSCFLHSGCQQCLNDSGCLWCPSLSRCVPSVRLTYPTTFNFGQCLGWIKSKEICDRTQCEDQTSCSSCQLLPHCGWCNDPSDSGLGVCTPGGFVGPLGNNSSCLVEGQKGEQVEGEWQFDVCSCELRC